tara:strand:- start:8729 stop:9409 length:681 start_codon:yes stop_codon:yes gene_type:complete
MESPTSNSDLSIARGAASITFTLTNLLTFLTIMSPFLLTFFMVMLSIVNNSIVKGLLFLVGLVIISYLTYLLKSVLKERQSPLASPLCNILPIPFTTKGILEKERVIFSSPILSTTLLGYISSYLTFPMYINNDVNYPLLIFLVALFAINGITELHKKCGTLGGVVLGAIVGITFGMLYYGMIAASGNKDLAYFSEIKSNAQGCKKPTDQKFKCVTYKRGERPMWG